jgi:hypothetical protein
LCDEGSSHVQEILRYAQDDNNKTDRPEETAQHFNPIILRSIRRMHLEGEERYAQDDNN